MGKLFVRETEITSEKIEKNTDSPVKEKVDNAASSDSSLKDDKQMVYGHVEAVEASCIYFDGDELAAKVWVNKYALKNSYGTQEFYTGAGSYYSNYDLRTGKWDASVFTTWQDAVKYSIGNILLPIKYQSA